MNELRKMNVYDVNETIENALLYGVDEYGEILEEEQIKELVDKLEMTLQTKMEYMAKLVVNTDPFVEAIDNEIAKLQDKKKATINGVNRTKDYLDRFIRHTYTDENGVLDEDGLKKFKLKTPTIEISYRKSSKVDIIDNDQVPSEFMNVVIESKPKKKEIGKYMKDNNLTETDYAKLVTNINMSIK